MSKHFITNGSPKLDKTTNGKELFSAESHLALGLIVCESQLYRKKITGGYFASRSSLSPLIANYNVY